MVGTSGSSASRFSDDTPSASSLPSRTCGTALAIGAMKNCTRPVIASASASGMPLNGMCTTSIFAMLFSSSPAKCVPLPIPADEKFIAPGLARAAASRSFSERKPEGETTSTYFDTADSEMPIRSRRASYGSFS